MPRVLSALRNLSRTQKKGEMNNGSQLDRTDCRISADLYDVKFIRKKYKSHEKKEDFLSIISMWIWKFFDYKELKKAAEEM